MGSVDCHFNIIIMALLIVMRIVALKPFDQETMPATSHRYRLPDNCVIESLAAAAVALAFPLKYNCFRKCYPH